MDSISARAGFSAPRPFRHVERKVILSLERSIFILAATPEAPLPFGLLAGSFIWIHVWLALAGCDMPLTEQHINAAQTTQC
jgi:hypothetical protein